MQRLKNIIYNRNKANSIDDDDDEMPRLNGVPADEIISTQPITEIDPDTLQSLLGIAVNILKQTIDNENQTMTNLVSIALDILKQTVGPPPSESIYTMPKPDVRYSNLTFEVTHKDNGQEQPKSTMSTITVLYEDVNDKLKITGYSIDNGENSENSETNEIYKKIIEALNLGDINLETLIEDLKTSKKKEIITDIIKKLTEENKIDQKDEQIAIDYLNIYLEKLAEAVSKLKGSVVETGESVNALKERLNN